ncbi:hypothetical protein JMUB5695_01018 [Mycobacterium heckeshornense]|uniref:Uncharacterized protein n=1 Tax=Mycobacterium heckeshornense TaxID=110505 RepID=A0A7R7TSV5_9MYCO|nr:hypothetical protein MHEC_08920 [Mycobacterium heckeshornense]BCQ07597.1 hypothetical protein JMUB5695_01018 [Mycobacterium heckeshornense]
MVSGLDEAPCDGKTHVAQADKSDLHPSVLVLIEFAERLLVHVLPPQRPRREIATVLIGE